MKQEENYTDVNSLFFDSYAIFEIIKGNPNYSNYMDVEIVTTKLNLFELYHGFLKDKNEELAENMLNKYYKFAIDFNEGVVKEAAKLKIKFNKRDVSMTDCIGYSLAKQLGIRFLTGDSQFKDLENVEFVL